MCWFVYDCVVFSDIVDIHVSLQYSICCVFYFKRCFSSFSIPILLYNSLLLLLLFIFSWKYCCCFHIYSRSKYKCNVYHINDIHLKSVWVGSFFHVVFLWQTPLRKTATILLNIVTCFIFVLSFINYSKIFVAFEF